MAFCITYLENLTFLLLLTGVIVYLYSRVFRTQRKAQPAASQKPFSDGTNWQRPPKITQLKGTAYNFKIGPKENHEILSPWPDYAALTGVPWPKPYDGFILHKALPRPYRPFRWPYHQTMSMSKLEPDWWLEIESTYETRISERKQLYRIHGKKILDWLPGKQIDAACRETMEMVLMWLVKRYPKLFELINDDGGVGDDSHLEGANDESERKGKKIFLNHILHTRTYLDRGIHPLHVLLEHVPEDFVLVLPLKRAPSSQPEPTLCAGLICSAIGWTLGHKLGQTLNEIHTPVPHYHPAAHPTDPTRRSLGLSKSLPKFFTNPQSLPPHKPIQRGSWSLELHQPLFVLPDDPRHSLLKSRQDPNISMSQIYLRVDWQTLRRLAINSEAVLFNFKAFFTPFERLRGEKGIPALFGKVLSEGDREIMRYKGTWFVEHVVIPRLREWELEQREQYGLSSEVETLEQSPFFERWEEGWVKEQGFE